MDAPWQGGSNGTINDGIRPRRPAIYQVLVEQYIENVKYNLKNLVVMMSAGVFVLALTGVTIYI
jgi:hypothetical protein